MKADRIFYQELFPTGMYANQKIGIEGTIEEGETEKEALLKAKNIVQEFFKESNKGVWDQRGTVVTYVDFNHPDYVKKEMDIIVKGWYEKAVAEGDTKTIEALEKEFIVPNA